MGFQNRGPFCRRDKPSDSSNSDVLVTTMPGGQEGAAEVKLTRGQSEGGGFSNTQEKTNVLTDDSDEKTDSAD